jgi:hypothetical protein
VQHTGVSSGARSCREVPANPGKRTARPGFPRMHARSALGTPHVAARTGRHVRPGVAERPVRVLVVQKPPTFLSGFKFLSRIEVVWRRYAPAPDPCSQATQHAADSSPRNVSARRWRLRHLLRAGRDRTPWRHASRPHRTFGTSGGAADAKSLLIPGSGRRGSNRRPSAWEREPRRMSARARASSPLGYAVSASPMRGCASALEPTGLGSGSSSGSGARAGRCLSRERMRSFMSMPQVCIRVQTLVLGPSRKIGGCSDARPVAAAASSG